MSFQFESQFCTLFGFTPNFVHFLVYTLSFLSRFPCSHQIFISEIQPESWQRKINWACICGIFLVFSHFSFNFPSIWILGCHWSQGWSQGTAAALAADRCLSGQPEEKPTSKQLLSQKPSLLSKSRSGKIKSQGWLKAAAAMTKAIAKWFPSLLNQIINTKHFSSSRSSGFCSRGNLTMTVDENW